MKKGLDQNVIRRSIALAIPEVLEAIATNCKKGSMDAIKNYLPKYKLVGADDYDISRYFTPVNLRDTGKRRIYMNGNGYFIRYLTRKSIRAVYIDARARFGEGVTDTKFYGSFANRWAIIRGNCYKVLTSWNDFVENVIFLESVESKDNHPPCGFSKFTCVEDALDHDRNLAGLGSDFMRPGARSVTMKLERYELALPKIGGENNDTCV